MPRPSKIDRLPAEIRDQIAQLRDAGRTIDEIMEQLRHLDLVVAGEVSAEDLPSRSGMHRHIQGLDVLAERMRRNRTISEALVRPLGEGAENRSARINIELAHSLVTELISRLGSNEEGQPETLDLKELLNLAKSINQLAQASKSDAELTLKIRKQIEAEQKAKLDKLERESAKGTPGKPHIDPETLRHVRTVIYGLPA